MVNFFRKNTIIILLLCCFTIVMTSCTGQKQTIDINKDSLKIKIIDIGQGDAILIKHHKQNILIDTGDVDQQDNLVKILKNEQITNIDKLIITHPHSDHLGGALAVLDNFVVGTVYDNGQTTTTKLYRNYLKKIADKKINYTQLSAGMELNLGDNLLVKILSPDKNFDKKGDLNGNSIVAKLIYKNFSMLFTGDIEDETEAELFRNYGQDIKSSVLKSPHHGSRTSLNKEFLNIVGAKDVIISVGKNNDYKHPHEETLKRYKALNMNVYRTDLNGTVTIDTNGDNYEIIKER